MVFEMKKTALCVIPDAPRVLQDLRFMFYVHHSPIQTGTQHRFSPSLKSYLPLLNLPKGIQCGQFDGKYFFFIFYVGQLLRPLAQAATHF